MIKFLIKGLLRDKSRSRLPVLVVTIGVMLTVLLHAYIKGIMGDIIEMNARFSTGHVKVMTKAYAENMSQMPNDQAILDAGELLRNLENHFPDMEWAPRIKFGGLIDAPDENGETKAQGPAIGIGLDLLSPSSEEAERLNLSKSIVRGNIPQKRGEVLLSEEFSKKLRTEIGDKVTLLGTTMNGSMTMYNFSVSGTVSFGSEALDRGSIIADITDIRDALDMQDATGEILGFFKQGFYDDNLANLDTARFSSVFPASPDEFSPVMRTLSRQSSMGQYVKITDKISNIVAVVFILAMSLVLWNAGLLGGLRRYGEVGLRLALGEEKGHVYRSMINESLVIGFIGSVSGTFVGLFLAWLIQKYGIDISGLMRSSSIIMPSVIRTHITMQDFYLGFFPGFISTVAGTMLSGIGIYKRQTASLFRELEAG